MAWAFRPRTIWVEWEAPITSTMPMMVARIATAVAKVRQPLRVDIPQQDH
ncbi:MAG: hypothetical protein ACOYD4_08570 [Solirubrobacterales bacterium]